MSKIILFLGNGKISSSIDAINIDNTPPFPKEGISLNGEATLNIGGPDRFVGYLGIDLASGISKTYLVKKETVKNDDR